MKIAYFTESYLPNIDGVVTSIISARKQLEKKGHKLWIFSPGSKKDKRRIKDKNVYFFNAVPFPPYPSYTVAILPRGAREKIDKLGIDIIHSHGMMSMGMAALYSAKRLNKPIIGTMHTNIQEATHYVSNHKEIQRVVKKIAWRYLKLYFNRCAAVIAPSEYMRRICSKNGIKRVVAITNGIDLTHFKPGKRTLWKNKIIALYVGRIVKEKNLGILIKSAKKIEKKIPNIQFIIVGSGPAEKYYKDLVDKYDVRKLFSFTGSIDPKKVIKYYQNADIFVFPSMFETQGLTGIEAMACGLPVAGADYLAIPDYVKNGKTGYLFNPKSIKGCTDSIIKTIKQRKKLGKNALKESKAYSIEDSTEKLLKLYAEVERNSLRDSRYIEESTQKLVRLYKKFERAAIKDSKVYSIEKNRKTLLKIYRRVERNAIKDSRLIEQGTEKLLKMYKKLEKSAIKNSKEYSIEKSRRNLLKVYRKIEKRALKDSEFIKDHTEKLLKVYRKFV